MFLETTNVSIPKIESIPKTKAMTRVWPILALIIIGFLIAFLQALSNKMVNCVMKLLVALNEEGKMAVSGVLLTFCKISLF